MNNVNTVNELLYQIDITNQMVSDAIEPILNELEEDGYQFSYDVDVLTKRLNLGDTEILDRIKTIGKSLEDDKFYDDIVECLNEEFSNLIKGKRERLEKWFKAKEGSL